MSIQDSVWMSYVFIDTVSSASGDSIGLRLSGGVTEVSPGTASYDACLFERL
jgi:hypothetical protein